MEIKKKGKETNKKAGKNQGIKGCMNGIKQKEKR
jgi:hypothetical protein